MATTDLASQSRLLMTLERLLAIPNADLETALDFACNAVGDALRADKVDAFLYDEGRDCLVALNGSESSHIEPKAHSRRP